MEKDFHYYGTYVAACWAGYSTSEAETIAHAAQYVDDSVGFADCNRLLKEGEYGIDFEPKPTSQGTLELFWTNLPKDAPQSEIRSVWVPFHFLPGNYESKILPDSNASSRMKKYTGPQKYGTINRWKYDDRAKWQFKLLCLPQSPLVTKMVNDIVSGHKDEPYKRHLIGLRMHVLADTGAHMYYAGTPAWHVNDAGPDVFDKTVKPKKKIRFGVGDEWTTIRGISYESLNYLGHGRMGHVPDYPCIEYEYTPKWSSEPIVKDNPKEYLRTFKEMVTALKCIREEREYDVLHVDSIDEKHIAAIDNILRRRYNCGSSYGTLQQRCDAWRVAISDGSLGIKVMPEEYDPDAWLKRAKQHHTIAETDYYKFNKAAIIHLESIKSWMKEEGIPLDDFK